MRGVALRLLVSTSTACAIALLIFAALPRELDVRTDVVGYSTFANFDVDRYFWAYGLTVVFVPLVSLGIYAALTRALVGPSGPRRPVPGPREGIEAIPAATGRTEHAVSAGRTLLVGLVLAFEAVIATEQGRLRLALAVALGYTLTVWASGRLATRLASRDSIELVSAVNTLAAALAVAGLYAVSESTSVTVLATGAVHAYPWLPAWASVGAAVAVLLWLGFTWLRARTRGARLAVERRAVLYVVAPVGLFLFVASLPGALGTVDVFEEGQVLAGSELVRGGAFPWSDMLPAHGLLHDVFGGLVGTGVFEDSRWGVVAGQEMLLEPFAWVAVYYLCAYLVGANWLYLLGTQLLVVTAHVTSVHIRFALLPLVVLLLVALLRKATILRAAAFTPLLAAQVIVTPEAMAAALAYLGTLVFFELYYYQRGAGLRRGFRRVWLCLASGVVAAAAWALYLAANGALDDWVFSFTALVPGHRLTGGIPLLVSKTEFEVLVPVALVLATFALVVARTRLRLPLALQDWAMVAMAGVTLLYYAKFLSRADELHLDHSFSVAVPLLFYAGYRAVTFGERWIAELGRSRGATWVPARHTLTAPLLLVLLVSAPVTLPDSARGALGHFEPVAPREPVVERIGFDRPGENDEVAIRDVSRAVDAMLEPGDTVFDFSNAPGLFHYLLELSPATRYYHVSLAIRRRTQSDLVRRLEESRPEVVVLTSDGAGRSLPAWDGIANQVRHYDVSQYLLGEFVPVLDAHGFVLMRRRDGGARPDRSLYFHVGPCDWGYVPNFFTPAPSPSAENVSLTIRPLPPARDRRWALTVPGEGAAAAYRWLEIRTGEPLREGSFTVGDRPGAGAGSPRSISFATLDRGETSVRVRVGSCSQWRGYESDTLYLDSTAAQDVREVRLVR